MAVTSELWQVRQGVEGLLRRLEVHQRMVRVVLRALAV